jgi:hypothetical protein
VKILDSSMFVILVLFSLCTFDMCLFLTKKDLSSFYNFKFCYTISQHCSGSSTSSPNSTVHLPQSGGKYACIGKEKSKRQGNSACTLCATERKINN